MSVGQPGGLGDMASILNQKVSLITNSNIRYEGVLIYINSQEMKLTLQNVTQYGTEGRNEAQGKPEIPAQPEQNSFPFVEFSMSMI